MRVREAICAAIATLLVSSCGTPLGAYRADRVSISDVRHLEAVDPDEASGIREPRLMRLDFSSKTDLIKVSDGGGSGLYLKASFCPFDDTAPWYFRGPFPDDKAIWYNLRETSLPSGGVKVVTDTRYPTRDLQGLFRYTAYLSIDPELMANFIKGSRDLCLRIDHPGYYLTPSQSEIFVLPIGTVRRTIIET